MIYGIGSIGVGMQRRRKEIRSERAAIREEFERWRKNNPYATAAEFHSKVKQLGSSTPGGGVALPDHQAIQQMAAQNQMQKQMVEQERERTRSVQDLNMTRAMSQGFNEYFANNPSANVSDAVNSMKLPLDQTTQALAENAQRGAQNKLAVAQEATETAKQERERAEIFAYMRQMTNPYYASYSPAQKLEEAARTLGYTLPSDLQKVVDKDVSTQANDQTAAAPSSPAQTSTMLPQPDTMGAVPLTQAAPQVTAAPTTAPQTNVAPALDSALGAALSGMIQRADGPLTSRSLEAVIAKVANDLTGGMRKPEDVAAAVSQNKYIKQLRVEARQYDFDQQLEGARDIKDLFASVDGQHVGLDSFLKTAANASGALEGLYIPPGSEAVLLDVLGEMMRNNAGETKLKGRLDKMSSSELQDEILGRIGDAGFVTIDEMKANRADALANAPELNKVEDLFSSFDENMMPDAAQTITAPRSIKERTDLKEENIEQLKFLKAIALNGRAVDQYAHNMMSPSDVLPYSELPRYQEVMGAYFDKRISALEAIDVTAGPRSNNEKNTEVKDAARLAAQTDGISAAQENPVGKAGVKALLDMGGYGFVMEAPIKREDGQVFLSNPLQPTEFEEQLRSENGPVIASAIKAALTTYLSYDAEMPDATGFGVLTSAVGRGATNWRTRTEAAKKAALNYMVANGIDNEIAKTIANNASGLHSQIFIRNNAPLSDQEAKDLLALLDGQAAEDPTGGYSPTFYK